MSTWLLISASVPVDSTRLPSVDMRDHLWRGGRKRGLDLRQLVFRRGEDHRDRLDLGDGDDAGLRGGIDDVADIDLAQPDDAGDRRLDGGVIELGLGVGNRGVIGLDLRGQLRDQGSAGCRSAAGWRIRRAG